jgi:hypothetical protein
MGISTSFNRRFALFKQTMICDTRDMSSTSLKTLTVLTFFISFILLQVDHGLRVGKGLEALQMMYIVNMVLLPTAASALFLPVIMDERKNQSMGLLLMTGIDSWGYIVGRCGSRFVQLLMIISLQIPFAILCVALGGITVEMVLKTYLYLFSYAFMICFLFVFCSLIFSQFFKGLLAAGFVFILLMMFAYIFIADESFHDFERYFWHSFEAFAISGIDYLYSWRGSNQSDYYFYVATFAICGLIFLLLTAFHFTSWAMDITPVNIGEKSSKAAESIVPKRMLKRERFSERSPIFTKDYYYIMHGRMLTILQSLALLAIIFYVYFESMRSIYHDPFQNAMEAGTVASFFALLIIAWYAGNRLWYEEIEAQTFNSLKMTPESTGMMFQKTKVVLRCMLPSIISLLVLGLTYMYIYYLSNHNSYSNRTERMVYTGTFFLSTIPAAFIISVYISLYLRKMRYLVSFGTCILIFIIEVMIIESIREYAFLLLFFTAVHVGLYLFIYALCSQRVTKKFLD